MNKRQLSAACFSGILMLGVSSVSYGHDDADHKHSNAGTTPQSEVLASEENAKTGQLSIADGAYAQTKDGLILASLQQPERSYGCKMVFNSTCDRPIETIAEVFKVCEAANVHNLAKHHANYLWVQAPPQIIAADYDKDYEFDVGSVAIHYFKCSALPMPKDGGK